jgi:hypothetical protein
MNEIIKIYRVESKKEEEKLPRDGSRSREAEAN